MHRFVSWDIQYHVTIGDNCSNHSKYYNNHNNELLIIFPDARFGREQKYVCHMTNSSVWFTHSVVM
jgi:hypothetical protein